MRLSRPRSTGLFNGAGLRITDVGADRSPTVRVWRGPARVAKRLGGKALSIVPDLQYQFIFVVKRD
jgi:hypothetical protein